jgi:hypothetical protein
MRLQSPTSQPHRETPDVLANKNHTHPTGFLKKVLEQFV